MASSLSGILAVAVLLIGAASAHYAVPIAANTRTMHLRGGVDPASPLGTYQAPPGMNMDAMGSMFNNPQFQKMAESLMENPEFKQKMDDMMKNETLMQEYAKIGQEVMGLMGKGGAPGAPGAGGAPGLDFAKMQEAAQNMMKDFLKPEKIQELATSDEMKKLQEDPKMQEIIKDVQTNGPMSVLKYYSDPNAMQIFSQISKLLGLPEMGAGMPGMPGMPGAGPLGGMGANPLMGAGLGGLGGMPAATGAPAYGAPKAAAAAAAANGQNFEGGAATDLE